MCLQVCNTCGEDSDYHGVENMTVFGDVVECKDCMVKECVCTVCDCGLTTSMNNEEGEQW